MPTLQGAGESSPVGCTLRQMTYAVELQSRVSISLSKSSPNGGGVSKSKEGGYFYIPGKGLRPLIVSDNEEAQQGEIEGMGSGRGAPGPSGGGGEPSSSMRMQIDFGKQPRLEPPILRDNDTRFNALTSPLVTSQGENSTILERTFIQGE